MITATASIFILHQSTLQVRIWQKILLSQGLTAIALPFSTDLRAQLLDMESNRLPLPGLILLEQNLPSFDTEKFCRWMQTHQPSIPIILLADQVRKVDSFDREEALRAGALELLPKFDVDTLAIEAVNGLKSVAKAFGNIRVVNDTLVSCIMELKREIEAEAFQETAPVQLPLVTLTPPQGQTPPVSQPLDLPKKTTPRKYRGRDY